jgi:hypothetical protein
MKARRKLKDLARCWRISLGFAFGIASIWLVSVALVAPLLSLSRKHAVRSCVLSIQRALLSLEPATFEDLSVNVSSTWQVLDDRASDALVTEAAKRRHLDFAPFKLGSTNVPLDWWKNRFQIAVRKKLGGTIEVLVWSKGPDGLSGTGDEIGPGPLGASGAGSHL